MNTGALDVWKQDNEGTYNAITNAPNFIDFPWFLLQSNRFSKATSDESKSRILLSSVNLAQAPFVLTGLLSNHLVQTVLRFLMLIES